MSVLFVSDVFPFPPRNGVTVPFCNYALQFQEHAGPVDLLVLQDAPNGQHRKTNQDFFRNVFEIAAKPEGTGRRISRQLIGDAPYFSGISVTGPVPARLSEQDYRIVLSTPRRVTRVVDQLRHDGHINCRFHVAAINDIATLAKQNLAKASWENRSSHGGLSEFAKCSLQRVGMHRSELNLLSKCCDLFIVQSDVETQWLKQQGNNGLVEKSIQLSNGVDNDFFVVPIERSCDSCVYIGRLDGEFRDRIDWLVEQVWPHVLEQFPESSLTLSGKCSDRDRLAKLMQPGVLHREFVEDPLDLFRDQSLLLAPIYKGFGLINRVVQSMAAGTVVIGDKTAFNGIPDFTPGKHGLVAERPDDFSRMVIRAFKNPTEMNRIRESARALITEHFQWDTRFFALWKKLTTMGFEA